MVGLKIDRRPLGIEYLAMGDAWGEWSRDGKPILCRMLLRGHALQTIL